MKADLTKTREDQIEGCYVFEWSGHCECDRKDILGDLREQEQRPKAESIIS